MSWLHLELVPGLQNQDTLPVWLTYLLFHSLPQHDGQGPKVAKLIALSIVSLTRLLMVLPPRRVKQRPQPAKIVT